MCKDIHLKVSSNTKKIFRHAPKINQKHLRLLYINNSLGYPRLAIQITKKAVKLAVIRNRIRRTIRESFRKQLTELDSYDMLLLITSNIYSDKHEISDILMQEWKLSIKLLQQSQS
ncbi:MAG: ribonuclease P protein component [Gammaproteobacteria bacterium]|nr:ribonuclease P protein component [Gammaproteobacteria bacterium]MBT4462318.1 ribonuclease P protein component [Gammaproteobacteria bacterium]MBT5117028.1 ribonuclease P protein component [Gammaproteobacteria bacterium]MBT5762060.1 ribonuclease P protein component [Gammaproteobacteria bacterium]MBT6331635.1 ribonuclease P protein component [Gammaproteobacteria bacterium]